MKYYYIYSDGELICQTFFESAADEQFMWVISRGKVAHMVCKVKDARDF